MNNIHLHIIGSETFVSLLDELNFSYHISFNKILTVLKDYYKPYWDLDNGGKELVNLFKEVNFTELDFRGKKTVRLQSILSQLENGKIDKNLFWI